MKLALGWVSRVIKLGLGLRRAQEKIGGDRTDRGVVRQLG
jgi:hypothetical protein